MSEFVFHKPEWFFALLFIPVLIMIHLKLEKRHAPTFQFSSLTGFDFQHFWNPDTVSVVLRTCGIVALIFSLADLKEKGQISKTIPAPGIDIAFAIDVSGSMMMEDLKPNRLEALKDVLGKFIAARSNDRIGMVLYAGESLPFCPLTNNSFFLLNKLNAMEDLEMQDGTAIGLGLASAVNTLSKSTSENKVIVLLTDGENNTGFIDPLTAASMAAKNKIKIYTIGVGTNGTAPFPLTDLNGNKVYQYVPVELDEKMLRAIAAKTGGAYFRAQNSKALGAVYSEIDKLEKSRTSIQHDVAYFAKYRLFLFIALFFLFTEQVLKYTYFRTFAR